MIGGRGVFFGPLDMGRAPMAPESPCGFGPWAVNDVLIALVGHGPIGMRTCLGEGVFLFGTQQIDIGAGGPFCILLDSKNVGFDTHQTLVR